jgi:hypothetical protein
MHHFEEGKHSLKNEHRLGCPRSIEHVDAIRALLAENLYLSQKQIACIRRIYHSTVKRVLRGDLLLRNVNFK